MWLQRTVQVVHVDLTVEYRWRESRAGKRPVTRRGVADVHVPEAVLVDVPVAARLRSRWTGEKELRFWGGRLWRAAVEAGPPTPVLIKTRLSEVTGGMTGRIWFYSEAEVLERLREWGGNCLIVEGTLYEAEVEPIIVVTDAGRLEIDFADPVRWSPHYTDSLWSILASTDAAARALSLGGPRTIPSIESIEILLPEAFHRDVVAEEQAARLEYLEGTVKRGLVALNTTLEEFGRSIGKAARSDTALLELLQGIKVAVGGVEEALRGRGESGAGSSAAIGDLLAELGLEDPAEVSGNT